jgi:hypothetical protein
MGLSLIGRPAVLAEEAAPGGASAITAPVVKRRRGRRRGHPLEVPVKHKKPFHSRFLAASPISLFVDRFHIAFHR